MSQVGEQFHLEAGHHLDRYELLCPIARGGMAWVWLACLHGKRGFEKLVAIKTILPQYASDRRFQRMFLDEARLVSRIEHINVAQILDLGESDDVLYLVMEWVDGDSLAKLRRAVQKRGEVIPMAIVLRIMADVSAGLHAAHQLQDVDGAHLGVVHRDISPQNILIGANGVVKLIDFGVATVRAHASGRSGMLDGKLAYMAPEQAIGKRVDRRSDVWAMGAVTYYLLTGTAPYGDGDDFAILRRLRNGEPPPSLPPIYPPELDALCKKAMASDPDLRMNSAGEFQLALEALMNAAGHHAATTDVAAYVERHLGEQRDARYRAIEHAVRAASERRCARLLPRARSRSAIVPIIPDEASDESTRPLGPLAGRLRRHPTCALLAFAEPCEEYLRAAALGVSLALFLAALVLLLKLLVSWST